MMPAPDRFFSVENKVIMVTGAAGIIGCQLSKELANRGALLILLDVNQTALDQLSEEINAINSGSVMNILCDVSNPDDVEKAVNQAVLRFSKIDVLFNNAATKSENLDSFFENFENYELTTWKKIMATNLDGIFLMGQAVGKQMIKQKKGNIIQTASIYGHVAPDQRVYENSNYLGKQINTPAVYSTSKAGVIGLTRHLATLLAEHNIRVNCISPGGIESGQNNEFQSRYASRVPLGRMASVDDIVGACIFLASEASAYITGQNIIIDGGLSVW